MKRSFFFLICAILSVLFGGMMLFAPAMTSENFGLASTPESSLLFRSLGGLILSMGILNFLVRNEPGSKALGAVLLINMLSHIISMGNDFYGVSEGLLSLRNILGGIIPHLFIIIGSLIYFRSMQYGN